MTLRDGRFQTRMRRWYELDQACAHGLTNLQMFYLSNNSWTNNRLMNVAAAFDSIGSALVSLPKEQAAVQTRSAIRRLITDPALKEWFDVHTQNAGRPSYSAMLTALHAPVAEATYPVVQDAPGWITALWKARNGLAHALEEHFVTPRDFRYEYALADVSHAVLLARLMHELGYTNATIREHMVKMPELRHRAEQWWEVTHKAVPPSAPPVTDAT